MQCIEEHWYLSRLLQNTQHRDTLTYTRPSILSSAVFTKILGKRARRAPASPDPTLCRLWSTALQWEVSGRQSRWTNQKLRRTTTSCGKPEAIPVSIISKALFPLKLPILFSSHPHQPNPLSLSPLPSNQALFSSFFSLDSPDP